MKLSEILGAEAVRAPLRASSKKRLLQELADFAAETYALPADLIHKALLDREAVGPTGVRGALRFRMRTSPI